MNLSREESNYINFLKIFLIIGVVLTHTTIVVPLPHDYTNITYNLIYLQQEVLGEFRVPTFFILSGYFFYKGNTFDIKLYIKKIRSKFKTLIIPYLIWSILAIILHIIYDLIKHHYSSLFNFKTLVKSFFFYNGDIIHQFPINGPLWYIRDLIFIIFILSPIIYKIITYYKASLILTTSLIIFIILPYLHIPSSLLISGIIWFTIGATISINNISLSKVLEKFNLIFFIYPIFIIIQILTRNMIIHDCFLQTTIILGLFCNAKILWYIYKNFIRIKINLNSYVMFLYCSHFITDYIKPLCSNLLSQMNLITLYLIISFCTILVCSSIYILLYKFNNKILNILVGDR